MKLRILRESAVITLRKSILENIELYRSGNFSFLDLDAAQYHELPISPQAKALEMLKMPVGEEFYEVENCLAVHAYLSELTPYDARDERLWCHLTHTVLLDYVRARWPIPSDDEKAVVHIETHFFARTNRQIERDNAASRLWWMSHLCTRVAGVDQKQALDAFLFRADVRANIIERPTIAQSTNVFSVILRGLVKSAAGKKTLFERKTFRAIMMDLNSIGGFRLLDVLPEPEIHKIFDSVMETRLGVAGY
ncbi:DUF6339 family protein [Mesorhizobium sp. VK9D]|uniref:DUF6339 family protein n=1 Tax=Mesorhizobium australafricanum TaxID=3072311 RepID=UPI002A2466B2|nr:DUF6339 family protein [Mesorhizobium sp. VK9D]MDX8455965.1 DUF6339 family protein [Mesorhizobium sp. VK9D]